MADSIELPTTTDLYEADEHAWIERQIAGLRDGAFDRLDRANLIEFLSSMAARNRRELASQNDATHAAHDQVHRSARPRIPKLDTDHFGAAA
jgi:hypothetical protein